MEYDRDGYRFDGVNGGLGLSGLNSTPGEGDYYTFVSGSLVSKATEWQTNGVAEADCLMCHLKTTVGGFRYSNLERNYAPMVNPATGQANLKKAATLGLAGPTGTTGMVSLTARGEAGANPNIAITGWNDLGSGAGTLPGNLINTVPDRENCALCHFADKSLLTMGPSSNPLGYTAFQKYLAAGSTADGDIVGGGNNTAAWNVVKGRAEFGKRGESINDPKNPDVHMGTAAGSGRTCSYCHTLVAGTFPAMDNGLATELYPALDVKRIDHQFAKGNNLPDGKNMDQTDNTVTCEGCHITGSHPNAADAAAHDPVEEHALFPASHFQKIDCRTCHIPALNFAKKQTVEDFTVGPFQTFSRAQVLANSNGIGLKPLYLYRDTGHHGDEYKIEPLTVMAVPIWVNGNSMNPTFQRAAKGAAEAKRTASGDTSPVDGVYDWPLNRAQGGDTALIVNTKAEITDMVTRLNGAGVTTPIMNFYLNTFDVSHNVVPLTGNWQANSGLDKNNNGVQDPGERAYILGDPDGGGCVMCHSSSSTSSPFYTNRSVGFFDKTYTLFVNPGEDDTVCVTTAGVVQTNITGTNRVSASFGYKDALGGSHSMNLADVADCAPIGNTLNQGTVLGYNPDDLAYLMDPSTAGVNKSTADFTWSNDTVTSFRVNLASTGSCYNAPCTYRWDCTNNGSWDTTGTTTTASCTYTEGGSETVLLQVEDSKGFISNKEKSVTSKGIATITASAGAGGSISPSGTVTVMGGQTYTITPNTNYVVGNVLVDGSSVGAVTSYSFSIGTSGTHTISAAFYPTITSSAGPNGSISPSGTVTVTTGTNQSYTITPLPGYHVAGVLVDGSSVGAVTSYTFTGVTVPHTISASFAVNSGYTITASVTVTVAGTNGTISPSGSVSVPSGTNKTFTMTPATGFKVGKVLVDGAYVGAPYTYTFSSVSANHTISVLYYPVITSSAGTGGRISPLGQLKITPGTNKTYTITPNTGYHIANVVVDGSSVGAVSSYTFTNVTAPHTISATFALNP